MTSVNERQYAFLNQSNISACLFFLRLHFVRSLQPMAIKIFLHNKIHSLCMTQKRKCKNMGIKLNPDLETYIFINAFDVFKQQA